MDVGLLNDARGTKTGIGLGASRGSRTAIVWALWAVVLANAAVIVWLWVHGGNISGVHSAGELMTSLGRITGLLSAYLALIQVLLLARLPPLERLAGFDHLTIWHRLNGKICLYLVLAHVVFITIGYAAMDRITIPPEVVRLLANYPGMVAATIGTVLLIAVVGASLVIVRRRLTYELWYLVHLSAYAGIALAWFHQVPTGNELTADLVASAYWNALYAITLALLVLFRVVPPLAGIIWYGLRVAEVTAEGPGVISLRLSGRRLDRLGARAGQFFLWRFLSRGRWWQAHPFSLSTAPDGRSLRLTVKAVGDFTAHLHEIAPGTRVLAEGPFGVFTAAARQHERVAFIAGGIGITPIRAMLEEMHGQPGDLVLVYRAMRDEEIIFREELDALARDRGHIVHYVIGDHRTPNGANLLSPAHLRALIPDIADRELYICGPPAMMRSLEQNTCGAGVPPRHIHTERFAL